MLLWRCAMILDPYSLPTLCRRRVGRCDVSRAMLESKHRRGGPTSLTTALDFVDTQTRSLNIAVDGGGPSVGGRASGTPVLCPLVSAVGRRGGGAGAYD